MFTSKCRRNGRLDRRVLEALLEKELDKTHAENLLLTECCKIKTEKWDYELLSVSLMLFF